jgi:tungstate transport system permease protein
VSPWTIAWLSVRVSGAAPLVAAAVGVPLGTQLGLARFPGKRLAEPLVFIGMGLPPVMVGLAVYLLLSREGPLGAPGWLFTPGAMNLAQVLLDLPLVTGLTAAAVEAVPAELTAQVAGLGATRRQARRAVLCEARLSVLAAIDGADDVLPPGRLTNRDDAAADLDGPAAHLPARN